MLARAEDGEHAIVARDRRAAAAWLAFVAGHRGVAKVNAPRALQQIAGRRRHVAKLRRGAGQNGLRQNRVVCLTVRVVGKVGIANRGANLAGRRRRAIRSCRAAGD